ncbi:hypothetical protein B0H66DRAFT_624507 [Apodospora peruviana]|uniref:Uncharacterized protein n=1 Tax=Apodospora peruviana TaxID=516989 RepID=A0AAE0HZH9_9PEZI|nr:hypothetical protein B0H66DRAFT_624507 [Apodospora peruviana]
MLPSGRYPTRRRGVWRKRDQLKGLGGATAARVLAKILPWLTTEQASFSAFSSNRHRIISVFSLLFVHPLLKNSVEKSLLYLYQCAIAEASIHPPRKPSRIHAVWTMRVVWRADDEVRLCDLGLRLRPNQPLNRYPMRLALRDPLSVPVPFTQAAKDVIRVFANPVFFP